MTAKDGSLSLLRNRADWLHELIQTPKVNPISRAHLPRLLDGLDWTVLNDHQFRQLFCKRD